MTPEERRAMVEAIDEAEKKLVAIMDDEIRTAVRAEREACAKLAENGYELPAPIPASIAAAIRARA
jgi:hypothetical protein